MKVLYFGRAPRTKETLPDFLKWRRVTRPPLVFRGLTGSQRTPGFWGVTPKTFDATVIGYVENSVAYMFLIITSENGLVEVNSIIETKNADFFENIFPWKTNTKQQVQSNLTIESSDPFKPRLRISKRERKETNFCDDFYTFLIDDNSRSYKKTMTSSDAPLWKEAINNKLN